MNTKKTRARLFGVLLLASAAGAGLYDLASALKRMVGRG